MFRIQPTFSNVTSFQKTISFNGAIHLMNSMGLVNKRTVGGLNSLNTYKLTNKSFISNGLYDISARSFSYISSCGTFRTIHNQSSIRNSSNSKNEARVPRNSLPFAFNNEFSIEVQNNQSRSYSSDETKFYSKEDHRKMLSLVRAWRQYGHNSADLDPLGIKVPTDPDKIFELKPAVHGLQEIIDEESNGGSRVFNVGVQVQIGNKSTATLKEIIQHMKSIYSSKTAAQFYHLESLKEIEWIAKSLERNEPLDEEEKKLAHKHMLESQLFDMFLQKKFPTTKRYGLEGAEAFVPVMDTILRLLNKNGFDDAVLGIPHRGRLNLLTGLFGYPPRSMFRKIKGNPELPSEFNGNGDVLSHLGVKADLSYGEENPITLTLLNNPSHLETVDPVAVGHVRASQYIKGKKSAAILVHGDSAVCSQGVVAETLQLTNLPHFSVNGTIHIIVNNQLGFTTGPKHYRSTKYSGDIGKFVSAPVFSVNAEHIEDVLRVVKIATEYKCKFGKEVFIEVYGYRRYGHNELDEAAFTQPIMYKNIRGRERYPNVYSKRLIEEGILRNNDVEQIINSRNDFLEKEYDSFESYVPDKKIFNIGIEDEFRSKGKDLVIPETGYDLEKLIQIGYQSVSLPEGFVAHPRLQKGHIEARIAKLQSPTNDDQIDWALGEALAVGSLLQEGYNVRISGQDASRGTFSQRHFKLTDQETESEYISFSTLKDKKGSFEVVSSPLSEYGVLGFEFGYSIIDSKTLVIFENQFGDFQNCAQVIFDTYIANSEDKWGMVSGITCLLPHGMDGAGPDHSSSRIERFLQMCDSNINTTDLTSRKTNMYVVNPTTPAQYFHLLRRQMKQQFRKPLIVISPKILLRLAAAQSKLTEMGPGTKFHPALEDLVQPHKNMKRLIVCSGKIFYDLHKLREEKNLQDKIALIRIEELNPFPYKELNDIVSKYTDNGTKFDSVYWAQEEHENQGAYVFVAPRLQHLINSLNVKELKYVGRRALSTSAVGNSKTHKAELEKIYREIFEGL